MATNDDTVTLAAVGDIILARRDFASTFARVAPILRAADLSFFNCETAYAEGGAPASLPHGAAPNDPRVMPALVHAGFDVCTLANNHAGDWGLDALVECRERLEALGIAVCGAGRNIAEARKPAIIERKGTRIAFLGYLSVGPFDVIAETDKPGCAMLRAYTHYEPYDYQPGTPAKIITGCYKDDLAALLDDVRRAKEIADIVVVTDHWGIHNIPVVIPDYEFEMAYAAIDAGADLILGTSTHILKGIEVYKGKVIVHSLADFVNEYHLALKEGEVRMVHSETYGKMLREAYPPPDSHRNMSMILKAEIAGKAVRRVSYVPVLMDEEHSNPEPLRRTDPRGEAVFEYMREISAAAGFDTRFSWDGDDEVLIATESDVPSATPGLTKRVEAPAT